MKISVDILHCYSATLQNLQLKLIGCEDKAAAVEKCCVDVLFNLSESHGVKSIEDHLYICLASTPTTAAAAAVSAASTTASVADKARYYAMHKARIFSFGLRMVCEVFGGFTDNPRNHRILLKYGHIKIWQFSHATLYYQVQNSILTIMR